MQDTEISRHVFSFDNNNGGESLTLLTMFRDNGDAAAGLEGGVYINQELTLNSYCNSATFTLCGTTLNPENLRRLANEIERGYNAALHKAKIVEKGN